MEAGALGVGRMRARSGIEGACGGDDESRCDV
jgi:hypothetical protein